jgi:hypothetical protein
MGDTAPVNRRYKYLCRISDRQGRDRWYLRKRLSRVILLPCGPGAKGFDATYFGALNLLLENAEEKKPVQFPAKPFWKDAGYIYFLRCGDAVKIGFSKEPLGRIASLKPGLPGPIGTVVTIPGVADDERRLQKALGAHRTTGE